MKDKAMSKELPLPELPPSHPSHFEASETDDERRGHTKSPPPMDPSERIPQQSQAEQRQRRQRYGLVVFSSLYTFLYVGAFFGWGPMQLLLEENGSFSSKCDGYEPTEPDEDEICPAQTSALVNVSFIAQMSQFLSPLLGQIADHYGAAAMAYLMAVSAWAGTLLLVFAAAYMDALLYPAFILIALSCWMGGMLTIRTGMVFAEGNRMRHRVIILLNSLFDAGSITYLGLWGISEASDSSISLASLAAGYFAFSIVIYGIGLYFWTVAIPEDIETGKKSKKSDEKDHSTSANVVDVDKNEISVIDQTVEAGDNACTNEQKIVGGNQSIPPTGSDPSKAQEESKEFVDESRLSEVAEAKIDDEYVLVSERPPHHQLLSEPFLMLLIIWTISVTSNMWVLVTTRDFLAYLGDDELGNKYLTIFTFMMPVSLIAVPFTDETLHKTGFGGAFQTINILALIYNLIRTLSDNLNVQVVGFVIYSFFRSFLFGVCFSYLPGLMSPNVVGKATGIMFALTGISALGNIALSNYAIQEKGGNFFIPNLIYTTLVFPCVLAAWRIGKASQRETEIRESRKQQSKLNPCTEREEPSDS